jgi:hypothetical protein
MVKIYPVLPIWQGNRGNHGFVLEHASLLELKVFSEA